MKQEAGHREGIEAISFAPSDLKFATASKDSTIKARDPAMHPSTDGHKLAHLCASPWCAQLQLHCRAPAMHMQVPEWYSPTQDDVNRVSAAGMREESRL